MQGRRFRDGVVEFDVDMRLLDGIHLPLCIIQCATVDDGTIYADAPRPGTVAALRDVLVRHGGPSPTTVLERIFDGPETAFVLAPEYALSSNDWSVVDELVRSARRPMVLVVGFGMASADRLREWATPGGETHRWWAWDEEEELRAPQGRYGGLWCWIHEPTLGTSCVCVLKNYAEQRHEAVAPLFRVGRHVARLRFADVDVFPLICAELLNEAPGGGRTPRDRIRASLAADGGRPVLVTGSLLQDRPWDENWQQAIGEFVANVAPGVPLVLALANQACGTPDRDEARDQWRSLSGVYAPRSRWPRGVQAFPGGRGIGCGGHAKGLVVRDDGPCIVGGPVHLAGIASPTIGQHLWRASPIIPLGPDGVDPTPRHGELAWSYELHRFTLRRPGGAGSHPRLARGLASMRGLLESASPPAAEDLVRSLLQGTGRGAATHDGDALDDVAQALEQGLHALASLSTLVGIAWQDAREVDGQLVLAAHEANVLVWKDGKRNGRAMMRELEQWVAAGEAHPTLLVVGSGLHGSRLTPGPVTPDRRSDWSIPPVGTGMGGPLDDGPTDITVPRATRSVVCVDLTPLVDPLYLDDGIDADDDTGNGILSALARALTGRAA